MTITAEDALEAMAEIERNTPQQIKTMRSHARISVRAKVTAQPANSSQLSGAVLVADRCW